MSKRRSPRDAAPAGARPPAAPSGARPASAPAPAPTPAPPAVRRAAGTAADELHPARVWPD